jgi:hypothetical protein
MRGQRLLHSFVMSAITTLAASGHGTAFTYRGRLTENGNAANGSYELEFALCDAARAENQIGTLIILAPVRRIFLRETGVGFLRNPRNLSVLP